MSDSDQALLESAAAGDVDALSELLARLAPKLRAEIDINPTWQGLLDADDILQISFLEAFLRIDDAIFPNAAAFYGWLRRVAENNLRDAIKGLERQKRPTPARQLTTPVGDESIVQLYELLGVTSATPSRAVAKGEMKSALEQALAALPDDYAAVIRDYDIEARSISETASRLGRSAGAVHMLRARAHDRLRDLLGPESQFFSRGP